MTHLYKLQVGSYDGSMLSRLTSTAAVTPHRDNLSSHRAPVSAGISTSVSTNVRGSSTDSCRLPLTTHSSADYIHTSHHGNSSKTQQHPTDVAFTYSSSDVLQRVYLKRKYIYIAPSLQSMILCLWICSIGHEVPSLWGRVSSYPHHDTAEVWW